MHDFAFTLDKVNLSYDGNTVLKAVTLPFERGKSYTILGPSGCGKTTLLFAIAGLRPPDSGNITFHKAYSKDHIAIILQEFGLFPWKTVWQNLILGLVLKQNVLDAGQIDEAKELATALGLEKHLHKYPHQLSGGQKQRVAIGRAWLMAPEIMLMDEPFSSLDAITRENLQNTIVKLSKERTVTWVTVTHSIEEAVFLGQEILLMSKTEGLIYERFINEEFGDLHLREKPAFYDLCLKVRRAMQEVHDEA